MSITGYYYLHKNGNLIYKNDIDDGVVADFRESDFVVMFWPIDLQNRSTLWRILIEALALGTDLNRIYELAEKWKCNNEDAVHYADYLQASLKIDGDKFMAT